jgi:catechol 2,3-dioxygenase-like lactoylglutathione lyase family enzyme
MSARLSKLRTERILVLLSNLRLIPFEQGVTMFKNSPAFASFAVPDISQAKDFYSRVLGLDVTEENGMLNLRINGGSKILVYPKPDFTPATYTILNFEVDDLEAAMDGLIKQGVKFEIYKNTDYATDDRGILRVGDDFATAWFKDPAGNIISLIQGG